MAFIDCAQISHLSFDKDGTIIDVHSYWAHTCSIRASWIARRFELSENSTELLLSSMGIDASSMRIRRGGPVGYKPRAVIIDSVIEALTTLSYSTSPTLVGEIFQEVDAWQQEHDDYSIVMLPGASEFFERLRKSALRATIVTSDRKINTEKVLARLGLEDTFHALVGGDSVKKSKPDPEGFLAACRLTNTLPERSAYIGDTIEDMHMAKEGNAGLRIGVETGLCTADDLRPHSHMVFEYLNCIELRGSND